MRISKLIERLRRIEQEAGDLEVLMDVEGSPVYGEIYFIRTDEVNGMEFIVLSEGDET